MALAVEVRMVLRTRAVAVAVEGELLESQVLTVVVLAVRVWCMSAIR
jgi:hypothetical protein